jgi:hypothetical protein
VSILSTAETDLRLVSRNMKTSGSLQLYLAYSYYAVDGNYNQTMTTSTGAYQCFHGSSDGSGINQWWRVDLQKMYFIYEVKVWSKIDSHPEWTTPFNVTIQTPSKTWILCDTVSTPGVLGVVYNISCNGIFGNAVRLNYFGRGYLALCEVEVWAKNCMSLQRVLNTSNRAQTNVMGLRSIILLVTL